jgi:hypothetical protein
MKNIKSIAALALASVALVGCGETPKGVSAEPTRHEYTAQIVDGETYTFSYERGSVTITKDGKGLKYVGVVNGELTEYTTRIDECEVIDEGYKWVCQETYTDEAGSITEPVTVLLNNKSEDLVIEYEGNGVFSSTTIYKGGERWTF